MMPYPTPYDLWVARRVLFGSDLNGELDAVTPWLRPVLEHIAGIDKDLRLVAWEGYAAGREDRDRLTLDLAKADPLEAAPEVVTPRRPASLADLRRIQAEARWVWHGWIPSSRIAGIGAFEGVGKTRFALDLSRRIYHALPWPDKQEATFPEGTPAIWICADGQQNDLVEAAEALRIPDSAIFFNTLPEDAYGGTDLDDPESIATLEEFIGLVHPGLVFIDSLTNATRRDLCRQNEVTALMAPVIEVAQRQQTTIIPLLHLAKDGQALGRRIKGITRTLIQLDCPDPDHPERLKLWVEKTFAKKPKPLGVTMTDAGNLYDDNPPMPPEKDKGGRPPDKRQAAKAFILEALAKANDRRATELCDKYVEAGGKESTFWNARDDLVAGGEVVCEGKPKIVHLKACRKEADVEA
jgi:hypothetical protein